MPRFSRLFAMFVLSAALASSVGAVYYDLGKNGDNKTNISWESRATVETILGTTNKVAGFVWFDAARGRHQVKLTIPVASIQTGIAMRDEHMRSAQWMDAERFPNIEFASTRITPIRGKRDEYTIVGNLTIHGVTKTISVRGTARRLAAIPRLESMGYVGDIIQLKTTFPVVLSQYGITVPENIVGMKMSNRVTIMVDVFGFTNNQPDRLPEGVTAPAAAPRSATPATTTPAAPAHVHGGHGGH